MNKRTPGGAIRMAPLRRVRCAVVPKDILGPSCWSGS